jgi:hypothetical protein
MAALTGVVTDDGLPAGGTLVVSWSQVSGPGTVSLANASAAVTTATFSEPGTYVLRLSATDSELGSSDEVTITVKPARVNQAPVVNAGADQTVTLPVNTLILNGTVSDDGLPAGGALTVRWSQVSGPGVVSFSNVNAVATAATFSAAGTYILNVTASDSQLLSSDTLTVRVNPAQDPRTLTLVLEPSSAGPNVVGSTQTMQATLKDQKGPLGGVVIDFTVNGANSARGNATADINGMAAFTYIGNSSGSDTVQASATLGTTTITSNLASVSWLRPSQPISSTTVLGRFFTSDGAGSFNIPPIQPPVFAQNFPAINFNPPAGTIPGNTSGVNVSTRPMAHVTTDQNGNFTGTGIHLRRDSA